MANTLSVDQIKGLVNQIVHQATGAADLAVTDTASLVTVGQKALLTGYDPIMNSISQVLARTIFAVRPYTRKFKGLEFGTQEWGNHVRKLNILDREAQDNRSYDLTDGASIDQYVVKKPEIIQTNFYGQQTYEYQDTIFEDQLKVSFTDMGEMNSFLSGIMTRAANQLEQAREELARACIVNMIGAKIASDENKDPHANIAVVKLITEFGGVMGTTYTDFKAIIAAGKLKDFAAFVQARIKEIMRLMEHRNTLFHYDLDKDKTLMRNTPIKDQRVYLLAKPMEIIEAAVYSQTFHEEYLKVSDYEAVSYWQSPTEPDSINVTAAGLSGDVDSKTGVYNLSLVNNLEADTDGVFGIIADRQAMGYTVFANKVRTSPFNAAGEYYNIFYKEQYSWFNDFSENAVVLLLK